MSAIRKHARVQRTPLRPIRHVEVDDDPLSDDELKALAENDGTFTRWEDLKAELKL